MNIKETTKHILDNAGVTLGGTKPWDPQVYNEDAWDRIAVDGSIGMGESFMDAWWDVEDLAELVYRFQRSSPRWDTILSGGLIIHWLRAKLLNLQKGKRAFKVGEAHYDLGNDLYQVMLDKKMIYTAAYWKDVATLDEAQEAKLDLICRKLDIQKGDRILDIGCGWGGFMKYAAEKYGAECVGLSVSKEQIAYAKKTCEGLPIEFVLTDYREYEPEEKFDHIVSIEMFEAVGHKNYRTFMKKIAEWLKDDGRVLLQTITTTHKKPLADPWLDKYIFPNGVLPNKTLIEKSMKGLFNIHDWHSIGKDYDKTLMAWWKNFDRGYVSLDHTKYDKRFYRMWKYYLQMCAGSFRSGYLDDWQILFTKKGVVAPDKTIR